MAAGIREQKKQNTIRNRNNLIPIFSSLIMENIILQAGGTLMQVKFSVGRNAGATARQVSSLQDLALYCSVRQWWSIKNPACHLTVQLVNIMRTLKKVDLIPRPGSTDVTDELQSAIEALQLRYDAVTLKRLQADLHAAQKRLESAPASLPELAQGVPKQLPLQMQTAWYTAALGVLNSLVDWLLQLCQLYYFNDVSVRYARFFLSRVVLKPTGEIDHARTVLIVLEDSMFHPGMNPCMFSVCHIGICHTDLVAMSKRVLRRLFNGAAVPQLARTPTEPKDVIKQVNIHISLNQRMQAFARSADADLTVEMQHVAAAELRTLWQGMVVVCASLDENHEN